MDNIIQEVKEELSRATEKYPLWPTDPLHALAVLGEEYGELTQAVLNMSYENGRSSHAHVREEAIQTAAMAIRFAMSLDQYEYKESDNHKQRHTSIDSDAPAL